MNSRYIRLGASILSVLLLSLSVFAQQQTEKKRWHAATFDGTSGLFKAWDAENLRRGETNWTLGWDQFQRDPGKLTIGELPVSAAFGIWDRVEFFGGIEVLRHITADSIKYYRLLPGDNPRPAATPKGFQLYNQDAPFIDVPSANGISDIHLGLKFNLLSERRGDSFSLGLAGIGLIPGQRDAVDLNRGMTSGSFKGGFAVLISKSAAEVMRFHLNLGYNFATDPYVDSTRLADIKGEMVYRIGAEFMPYKPYRLIAELNAARLPYYGSGPVNQNPRNPMDLIVGLRVYPKEWLSFGAGYQASLTHIDDNVYTGAVRGGYNGFVVQAALATRRNDPPTVTCAAAKQKILQGETTTIRANAVDPDGDTLTFKWSATGGKISGTDSTATFDATDVAPGKYTVTVVVADKKHEASCSVDITVQKRNYPPTAKLEPPSANVTQGESVNFTCVASDANKDPLTYTWTVDGEKLAATGPQITFGTEGRKPGTYNVKCSVSDGEATTEATAPVTVRERVRANQPPTIECLTTTLDVASGSSIELRARASDPDKDRLSYSWSSTGGSIRGTGETVTFDATGVKAGSYTVTATVDDGRGGKASCSMMVYVSERISVTKDKCGYFPTGGTRVDNCAKAILDDLAVRMKNEPNLRANVIGYTDASRAETARKGLGERRAKAVAAYLTSKGVDSSRLKITDGAANNPVGDNKTVAGRRLNRRVEIELTAR